MALVVGAILGIAGLSATQSLAYTGPVEMPNTSDSNKPSYWGSGCTKLDRGNGSVSWTADASYSIVVLKSGNTDYVFYDVVAGDVLTIPQDISHFIFCPPTTTTTTVPDDTTTTTVPDDTTTTTVPDDTTTTVPDDTTTTTVPDDTTTTTVPDDTTTTTVPDDTTTTTVPDDTTTTTDVGQQGPTTTVAEETTTTVSGQQGPTTTVTSSGSATTTLPTQLPSTGSEMQIAVLGGVLMAAGVTLLTVSRRRIV